MARQTDHDIEARLVANLLDKYMTPRTRQAVVDEIRANGEKGELDLVVDAVLRGRKLNAKRS